MSTALQLRAKQFLERPVPSEIKYVPGSLVEIFLAAYSQGEELDPELIELANIAAAELENAADAHSTSDAKAYFQDCKAIMEQILTEL
jgi:hypothetical protein